MPLKTGSAPQTGTTVAWPAEPEVYNTTGNAAGSRVGFLGYYSGGPLGAAADLPEGVGDWGYAIVRADTGLGGVQWYDVESYLVGTEGTGPQTMDDAWYVRYAYNASFSGEDPDPGVLPPVPAWSAGAASVACHAFPFAFDTAGLADGLTAFTPAVGDVLMDAWFVVTENFDADPAFADLQVEGQEWGWFDNYLPVAAPLGGAGASVSLSLAAMVYAVRQNLHVPEIAETPSSDTQLAQFSTPNSSQFVRFATTDPVKVWVSQEGSAGGTPIDATGGAATLYLLIASPA